MQRNLHQEEELLRKDLEEEKERYRLQAEKKDKELKKQLALL
jgi:hypothetical protein